VLRPTRVMRCVMSCRLSSLQATEHLTAEFCGNPDVVTCHDRSNNVSYIIELEQCCAVSLHKHPERAFDRQVVRLGCFTCLLVIQKH